MIPACRAFTILILEYRVFCRYKYLQYRAFCRYKYLQYITNKCTVF